MPKDEYVHLFPHAQLLQDITHAQREEVKLQAEKRVEEDQVQIHQYYDTLPIVAQMRQAQPPQDLQPAQPASETMSRSQRKKQESLAKMERKSLEATRKANQDALQSYTKPKGYDYLPAFLGKQALDSRLKAIRLSEDYALEKARSTSLPEEALLEIRMKAQRDRAEAYAAFAVRLPMDSELRKEYMEEKEKEEVKAHLLKKQLSISRIPNEAERKREEDTFKRHGRFDMLKKLFRTPTPFSRQDATIRIKRDGVSLSLVNVGRTYLGGTKVMYTFLNAEEQDASGQTQQYLYKEATNCVGLYKPEGAIITEAASKLQHYLRGDNAYIPAYCVRDKDGKVCGSVQKKMEKAAGGVDLFSWQAKMDAYDPNDPPEDLPAATKSDLLCEHTLDWILCNFDTKGENFINQPGEHIVSFDKEASFNHLMDDEAQAMSYTYKPHSNETIYNTLFRAYAQGRIDLDLRANLATIERMMSMPDYDFIAMFDTTLNVKYDGNVEKVREAKRRLLSRKNNLLQEYERFYTELVKERAKNVTNPHGEVRSSLHPSWKFQFRPTQQLDADLGESVGSIELEEDMEELVEEQVEEQI